MNLAKSYEFFNPDKCKDTINIIGCGSVGSTVAELLSRHGLKNAKLYDFDVVEEHNLVNQMFTTKNLYKPKLEAVYDRWVEVNPEAAKTIKLYGDGWDGQKLSGYVFMCVDNIELRKRIVEENKNNINIKAMFDFRTALDTAQHYAADWSKSSDIKALLDTMDFTHEEAHEATPVSACGVELSVVYTVKAITAFGIANMVKWLQGQDTYKTMAIVNMDTFTIDAFKAKPRKQKSFIESVNIKTA